MLVTRKEVKQGLGFVSLLPNSGLFWYSCASNLSNLKSAGMCYVDHFGITVTEMVQKYFSYIFL